MAYYPQVEISMAKPNPQFNFWNQNLRVKRIFFNWKSNQYETPRYIFTWNLEKISTSHVIGTVCN